MTSTIKAARLRPGCFQSQAIRHFALVLALQSLLPAQNVSATVVKSRIPSDIADVDLIVSCDPGQPATDYTAETASGVPLTDPYAVTRGVAEGLVSLMSRGGKRVKTYSIPRQSIRGVVRMKYDMDVLDRVDLVFTRRHLALIHTSTANAGIFTVSDVYELPYEGSGGVNRRPLAANPELLHLLDLGLSAYQTGPVGTGCRTPSPRAP
jgi:hypothetical protein